MGPQAENANEEALPFPLTIDQASTRDSRLISSSLCESSVAVAPSPPAPGYRMTAGPTQQSLEAAGPRPVPTPSPPPADIYNHGSLSSRTLIPVSPKTPSRFPFPLTQHLSASLPFFLCLLGPPVTIIRK